LIQKNPKEELVTFNLTVTKQGNNVSFTTPVELGDFIIMQELCRVFDLFVKKPQQFVVFFALRSRMAHYELASYCRRGSQLYNSQLI